jgi:signal transduction histidine kinase
MTFKALPQKKLILVFELAKQAHSSMDTEKCVDAILDKVSDILGTELGSVMLVDDKKQELFIKRANRLNRDIIKKTRVKIGEGISGWVAKEEQPLLVKDLSSDRRFKQYKKKTNRRYTTDSLLSVPFKVGNRVIGVINVNNKKAKRIFTKKDLQILSFIAEETALAIQNALIHEQAKRLAELKLDFVSDISHELKNPLAIIRESISLVLDKPKKSKGYDINKILNIAQRNIGRLDRLLESLLDLAKLEAGKAPINRIYLDMKRLLNDCVDFVKYSVSKKSIKLKTDFSIRYSKAWADHDRITQVVNNLLSNALKFTPESGNIAVKLQEKGKDLLISVQDTGVGMKKRDLKKLFNKFERLDVYEKDIKGTGLGLAICKEIIDMHQGKIWAVAKPGKGSRFNILLPRDLRREKKD